MGLLEVLESHTVTLDKTSKLQATICVSKALLYSGQEVTLNNSNVLYRLMYDPRAGKTSTPAASKNGSSKWNMTISEAIWGCIPVARNLHIAPMYFMFGKTSEYIYVDMFIAAPSVVPQVLSEVEADEPLLICGYRVSNMHYAFAMGARRRVTYYLDGTDRDESIDLINVAGDPQGYVSTSSNQTPIRSGLHEVEAASANINISPSTARLFTLVSSVNVSSKPSSYTLTVNHSNTATPTIK